MRNALLSLHIIAVISWMAGVLYLYRLLVYHVEESESVVRARFRVMEARLYRYITLPAMYVAIIAGAGLLSLDARFYLHAHWMHAKLTLVLGLIASTRFAGRAMRQLAAEQVARSSRTYRILNEVPTLLMILIVILVVAKPF